jgi:3-methyladenine DNA glycosylase AlkD
MTIDEIKKEIENLSDADNKEFFEKLNPTCKPSAGVRIPQLRKLAQKIAKEDYKWFLENNPLDTFEMESLQAFVIGYVKDDIGTILSYLKDFIPKVHDWSVNDSLCQTFKIARKYQKETWDLLMKFKDSKKEYEVRVVAIMMMSQFLNEEYIDRVIEVLNSLYAKEYYSQMGVAWAVATAMAKFPDQTYKYMVSKDNYLDDWTYNKALQKMKESFRVDNTIVDKIKKNTKRKL